MRNNCRMSGRDIWRRASKHGKQNCRYQGENYKQIKQPVSSEIFNKLKN